MTFKGLTPQLVVFCMVTESDDLESLFSSDTEDAETGAPVGFLAEVCAVDVSKELGHQNGGFSRLFWFGESKLFWCPG